MSFGDAVIWESGDRDDLELKYTGKDLDEDTGLYYFNARWYDADTGRFISEDPARDGSNWFIYTANNPLGYVDPTGLNLEKIISGIINTGKGAVKMTAGSVVAAAAGVATVGLVADNVTGILVVDDVLALGTAALAVGGGALALDGMKDMGAGLSELADGLAEAASEAMNDVADLLNEAAEDGVEPNVGSTSSNAASLDDLKKNPPGDFKLPENAPTYTPPKKWNGEKVKNPNGPGAGWPSKDGNVWVPTDHKGTHAPHWDVQNSKTGGHENVYPEDDDKEQEEDDDDETSSNP